MKYDISEKYNCAVIEVSGNVMGGPHADKFREDLHNLIREGRKNVIVDVGKVKFMNSSGLGILIGGLTTMRNAGGDLRIARADKKVESLLMVTHLTTIFKHFKTVEEAVNSYNK
ncbi:MAG: anti-sigma factor antagonist [Balneolaceae bacterium]|jgi:anti-sigma B factor antagonist|nr:MAG: anti-sigma factor antagonist [Balneolaceae bacterium]